MILTTHRELKESLKDFGNSGYISLMVSSMDEENSGKFTLIIKDVIDNYHDNFQDDIYTKKLPADRLYEDYHDNIISFLIPFLRRVYSKFFIDPPSLIKDKRLELFQLKFNIREIVFFFREKIIKNLNILDDFENIDRYPAILSIICDDYVSMKVSEIQNIYDIKSNLRDLKIEKIK